MLEPTPIQLIGTALFGIAVLHTFSTSFFHHLAQRQSRLAGVWHLLGEVEVVFGLWAMVLVLCVLGVLAWQLNRVAALRRPSRWLAALVSLQLATGLSNVVLDWPLVAAVLHTGGAGALVMVMTWALAASRTQSRAMTVAAPKFSDTRHPA